MSFIHRQLCYRGGVVVGVVCKAGDDWWVCCVTRSGTKGEIHSLDLLGVFDVLHRRRPPEDERISRLPTT